MGNKTLIFALLLVSWLPIKGFMQPVVHVFPILIFLIGIVTSKCYASRRAFVQLFIITSFYFFYGLLFGNEKSFYNVSLSLLLLMPFFMYLFRFKNLDESDFLFFIRTVAWLSIIELFLGVGQLVMFQGLQLEFVGNAWDKVIGSTLSQSSHVYSIKMLFQGFILAFNYRNLKVNYPSSLNLIKIGIICAFLGALISSYMVGIIMSLSSLIFYYFLTLIRSFARALILLRVSKRKIKLITLQVFSFFIFSGASLTVFAKLQPGNFKLITIVAERLISVNLSDQYKFQKIHAFEQTYHKVLKKDLTTFLVGLGPGQYSSRAALILTGDYLNPHPSYFPESMSNETRQIIWPLWDDKQQAKFRGSVLAMPSSSLMSVIAEFGFLGFLFLIYSLKKLFVLKEELNEGFVNSFVSLIPIFVILFLSQLVLDLWLEFASFTIFVNLFFIMCLSIQKRVSYEI